MKLSVGIDKIGLYVPEHFVDMIELAKARGVEPEKYTIGIGQDKMALPTLNDDIVSMAVNAATSILTEEDKAVIDQVIIGTESAFDYSKSAASWVHELLGIQSFAKAFEIKQACYGATAGLMSACDYVRLRPERKVLVIASDIAKYGLNTGGEPTQGAGAVALLVSANPQILSIDASSAFVTSNHFDFWRPNYSDVALVDGKFSTQLYMDVFIQAFQQFLTGQLHTLHALSAMVFHIPFTKMGKKALDYLALQSIEGIDDSEKTRLISTWLKHYEASTKLGREVGNIYTGSLYLSLVSLLMHHDQLSNQSIGLFSYGSGAVGELFTGKVQPTYKEALNDEHIRAHLNRRKKVTITEYETLFTMGLDMTEETIELPQLVTDKTNIYLTQIEAHKRLYSKFH